MGVVKEHSHTVGPESTWFAFFLFHINQITIPEMHLFRKLTLKNPRSRSCVSQRSRSHNWPQIQPMLLLFISRQLDQPFLIYVQESVWPWKSYKHALWDITTTFVLIGWVVRTLLCRQANFLIIATAVTSGQGHGKVIQYIFPDQYLFPKYIRLSTNSFDMSRKNFVAAVAAAAEMNWKHKITPDQVT